jgi:hypothetical protein
MEVGCEEAESGWGWGMSGGWKKGGWGVKDAYRCIVEKH